MSTCETPTTSELKHTVYLRILIHVNLSKILFMINKIPFFQYVILTLVIPFRKTVFASIQH